MMAGPSLSLQNGDRVAIVGGGPAGSFFAIHLLREARRLNRHLDVIIVEKRGPTSHGSDDFRCKGCNFCAGLISPRLNEILQAAAVRRDARVAREQLRQRMEIARACGRHECGNEMLNASHRSRPNAPTAR